MVEGIPIIQVSGKTLPETWEKSVFALWDSGIDMKTEYDRENDPPSKDCTMIMVVEEPFAEPRIHRAIPASLEDLEIYRQEVLDGIHDYMVGLGAGKWPYSYHERLFNYQIDGGSIDQIAYIIDKLSAVNYSRRAQAITWNPKRDENVEHPPCLQRVWCRVSKNKDGVSVLNMNLHWRSRDAYKAAFMNIYALTELQRFIADEISKKIGEKVLVGRYVDVSDSYHIYGSYFESFKGFLKMTKQRSFEERTWTTEFAEPFFKKIREKLGEEKSKTSK
jgi:thymidylate synthase